MATYTTYPDGSPITRSGGSNSTSFPKTTVFENTFDATRRPVVADDIVDVLNIPAGAFVHKVFVIVENGEAAQTMTVQDDDGTPTVFATAVSVATSGTRLMGTTTAAGKFYPTGGKLRILVPTGRAYNSLRVKLLADVTAIG